MQSVGILVLYSKSDGIHLFLQTVCFVPPCTYVDYIESNITFLLHAYLVREGYFNWTVIVADFLTHPLTMPGNVNGFNISSEHHFYFCISLLSKMFCYNFAWKNFRRDANGPLSVKSKMVLNIIINPAEFRDSCSKCLLALSVWE